MLGNTPTQPVDFFVERSKSFAFCVKIVHEDGTPVDLTDYNLRLTIQEPRRLGGSLIITNMAEVTGVEGAQQFRLQAADLALTPGEYPYDITLTTPEFYAIPLSKGVFTIGSNTDAWAELSVYDFSDPEQWITYTIKNNATVKVVLGNSLALSSVWLGGAPGSLSPIMLEAIQDAVAGLLVAGDNVGIDYNDGAGTLTVSSTGGGGGGGGSFTGYNPIYALAYEA